MATSKVEDIQRELEGLRARIRELESDLARANQELSTQAAVAELPLAATSESELGQTLRRLLGKAVLILQAEKALLMLYDKETGELVGQRPAVGLTDEQVSLLRVRATDGVSGEVFRTGLPQLVEDSVSDPRTLRENVALLHLRNQVSVPLIAERRDEDSTVIESNTIGVMHVFNKRFNQSFNNEDVRLLPMLAKQAAAIISNAQAYLQIAEAKRNLEATLQSMLTGVVVINIVGKINVMNAAARRIFNVADDNTVGRPFPEVITHESARELLSRTLREGAEFSEEVSFYVPYHRIFQVQTALVREDGGTVRGAVMIFNDITDIREMERMKTNFVSQVSHELRTPLTSIKGFIATLLEDTEGYYDRETQREFYTIIDSECDRLTRLINDLLNVSRIESGAPMSVNWKVLDLVELAYKVIQAQKSYATDHEFAVEAPPDFPRIMADPDKMDQVFTNLVNNAIKYSPQGGLVGLRFEEAGERVRVCVEDHGIGIPPEHLERVFERFHRVDNQDTRQQSGTGIGLFLVKNLVEAHHGKIWAESRLGEGSRFVFELPKSPPKEEREKTS